MNVTIRDHLRRVKEQVIPPLGLELVLESGQRYFVKWIFKFSDEDESITIRIWDTRALDQADVAALLTRLKDVKDRSEYEDIAGLHPKLDQGNLHVCVDSIESLVEWHDRLWPMAAPEDQSRTRRTISGEVNHNSGIPSPFRGPQR